MDGPLDWRANTLGNKCYLSIFPTPLYIFFPVGETVHSGHVGLLAIGRKPFMYTVPCSDTKHNVQYINTFTYAGINLALGLCGAGEEGAKYRNTRKHKPLIMRQNQWIQPRIFTLPWMYHMLLNNSLYCNYLRMLQFVLNKKHKRGIKTCCCTYDPTTWRGPRLHLIVWCSS